MAKESVPATPKLDTDNHAQLKAGVPIVISHDEETGCNVVMCNTMPVTDTTFVCALCGSTFACIGLMGYHSSGRCYFAYKQAVMKKYHQSKDPDVTTPVVPPFYTKEVSDRLPTFPVNPKSIKNFKTIPKDEKELFHEAFPKGKPIFKWFSDSVEGKKVDNPEPLFTRYEKYYFIYPAVGSGQNLKTNNAELKSALAASKAENAAKDAKIAALEAAQMNPSAVVEKPAVKKVTTKAKESKKRNSDPAEVESVRRSSRARKSRHI